MQMSPSDRFAASLAQVRGAAVFVYDGLEGRPVGYWHPQPRHLRAIRQAEPDERPYELSPQGVYDADLG